MSDSVIKNKNRDNRPEYKVQTAYEQMGVEPVPHPMIGNLPLHGKITSERPINRRGPVPGNQPPSQTKINIGNHFDNFYTEELAASEHDVDNNDYVDIDKISSEASVPTQAHVNKKQILTNDSDKNNLELKVGELLILLNGKVVGSGLSLLEAQDLIAEISVKDENNSISPESFTVLKKMNVFIGVNITDE